MPQIGLFFAAFYLSALLTALAWNLLRALTASIWLAWHRTVDAPEHECAHPIAVAFLIHGTWAPRAQWIQPGSALRSRVESALGPGRVRFEPFAWSGRNRISARREATLRLRVEMERSLARWPGVAHYIIAHSHGGNIALSACDSAALANRVAGVICLSTPFLHARARNLGPISVIALSAAPAYLVLSIGQVVALAVPAAADAAAGLFAILALGAAVAAPRLFRRAAAHLQQAFVTTRMPPERVLIIRTPGDEASAALSTAHFVSWLIGMTWSIPGRALANAFNTVEHWDAALARHRLLVIPTSLAALVLGFYLVVSEQFATSRHWRALGSTLVSTSLTLFAIQLKGGTYGLLLGILFAGLLVAPVPLLLGLAALPISAELALAAILLEVTAESTPGGAWTVQQLGGVEFARQLPATRVMMHSASYEHPLALQTIADWLAVQRSIGNAVSP